MLPDRPLCDVSITTRPSFRSRRWARRPRDLDAAAGSTLSTASELAAAYCVKRAVANDSGIVDHAIKRPDAPDRRRGSPRTPARRPLEEQSATGWPPRLRDLLND